MINVFEFILAQVDYTGSALSQAQVEMMAYCGCIFLIFVFAILAAYFLVEVIKYVTGGLKR